VEGKVAPDPSSGPDGGDLFAVGGEAGQVMAAVDWASTPVGGVEGCPAGFRHAVRTVRVSRFPPIEHAMATLEASWLPEPSSSRRPRAGTASR
jgi:hypothetical protein